MYKMSDMPPYARPILEQLIEFSADGLIRIHPKFIKWLHVSRFKFDRPDLALRCAEDCKSASLSISQFDVCSDSICQECDIRFSMHGFDNVFAFPFYIEGYLKTCGVWDHLFFSIGVGMGRYPRLIPPYLLLHFENRLR